MVRTQIRDVQVVNGHTESFYNLGYEDYAEVGIRFKNGVNGLAVVSWRTRIPSFRVEVVGEFGRRLALSKSFGMFDVGLRKAAMLFAKENILSSFFKERQFLPLGEEFYKMLRYFANCILNDEKPEPSGDDLVRVSEIIDSVYNRKSLMQRR